LDCVDLGSGLVKGLDTTSPKCNWIAASLECCRPTNNVNCQSIEEDIISITAIAGQEVSVSRLFSRAKLSSWLLCSLFLFLQPVTYSKHNNYSSTDLILQFILLDLDLN